MTRLLGYELKKMLRRPFTLVVLVGCIAVIAFIVFYGASQTFVLAWGPNIYGSYEAIPEKELKRAHEDFELTGHYDGTLAYTGRRALQLERAWAETFDGTWDDARLQQIAGEYLAFVNDPEIYDTSQIDDWGMQMRRWGLYQQGMSEAEVDAYDAANPLYVMLPEHRYGEWQRWAMISTLLDNYVIRPDGTTNSFAEAFPLVRQPAQVRYAGGPERTISNQASLIGIMLLLLVMAGVSPIFCDEVAQGTEPMLLAAKYGRDKLIRAKVLACFIYAAGGTLLLVLANYVMCGAAFGFGGLFTPIHLHSGGANLPFAINFLQYLLLVTGFQVLAAVSFAALLMLLSAFMRSAFPVVFAGGLFAFLCALVANQSPPPWRYLCQALPPGAALPSSVLYDGWEPGLGFLPLPQWSMPLILCALIVAAASVAVLRRYKNKR